MNKKTQIIIIIIIIIIIKIIAPEKEKKSYLPNSLIVSVIEREAIILHAFPRIRVQFPLPLAVLWL